MALFDYIKSIKNRISVNYRFYKLLRFPLGKKTFFIGTPEYANLGDSAIAIAQMLFLEKCGFPRSKIKEFTQSEYNDYAGLFSRYINKRHLICGIGGGNLGNLWPNEEEFRYRFIDAFPNNPIVIFPQTVFFTEDEEGRKAIEASKQHYEKHRKLTIVAREQISFDRLKTLYRNPAKLLTPDIVLSTTMDDYGVTVTKRSGGLLVFRNDAEKAMADEDRQAIVDYLNENSFVFRTTDMYSDEPVTKENRMELVRKKMQEFADAEFVITDRLHGMVFAAITETPCIALSNNHHKVSGTYNWISYLPYIKYSTNIEEVLSLLPRITKMGNCTFDSEPLLKRYDGLAKEIKRYVN